MRKIHPPPPRSVLLSLRQPVWVFEDPGRIRPTDCWHIGVSDEDVGEPGATTVGRAGCTEQPVAEAEAVASRFVAHPQFPFFEAGFHASRFASDSAMFSASGKGRLWPFVEHFVWPARPSRKNNIVSALHAAIFPMYGNAIFFVYCVGQSS